MSEVISQLGVSSASPDGVTMLGVCEIENKAVLLDLASNEKIKSRKLSNCSSRGTR